MLGFRTWSFRISVGCWFLLLLTCVHGTPPRRETQNLCTLNPRAPPCLNMPEPSWFCRSQACNPVIPEVELWGLTFGVS